MNKFPKWPGNIWHFIQKIPNSMQFRVKINSVTDKNSDECINNFYDSKIA